jgi:hypothetical protein
LRVWFFFTHSSGTKCKIIGFDAFLHSTGTKSPNNNDGMLFSINQCIPERLFFYFVHIGSLCFIIFLESRSFIWSNHILRLRIHPSATLI